VDLAKLRDYCLSTDHPRGRHKAMVFAAALGMTADHAEPLRLSILAAAADGEAAVGETDEYGQRYVLDCMLEGPGGRAVVRTAWMVRRGEEIPRLTTCWVL
jgi:hypothetical protein